ncbi:MAG: hypothetical protein F4150_09345 [Chloroflexi bacterium]|nr:hypothetical protein [Chloroflexota bacterium]
MATSAREQYEARLAGYGELVFMARAYQTILESFFLAGDPETWRMLETYRAFFGPVARALTNDMFLHAASAVDRDTRTASLPNLLRAARESPEFAPGADVRGMEEWLSGWEELRTNLRALRDKRLAHFDAGDLRETIELRLGINYGAFRVFLEDLHRHHVTLLRALDGHADAADPAPEARAHSSRLRRTLLGDPDGP